MIDRAVGIIGGIGPMSTVYFYKLVLSMTDAEKDQDHVNMIILNHASIPDRTAYICSKSDDSPLPFLIKDLEKIGASFIVIPCNTAHYFFDEVQKSVSIPVLNIVEEAVGEAKKRFADIKKLGVLATDGTVLSGTYELACSNQGIQCVLPDKEYQKKTMHLIYDVVKAGKYIDRTLLVEVIEHMRKKGCSCIVLGCTELSVAKEECGINDSDVLDSLCVLAKRTVEESGKKLKKQIKR